MKKGWPLIRGIAIFILQSFVFSAVTSVHFVNIYETSYSILCYPVLSDLMLYIAVVVERLHHTPGPRFVSNQCTRHINCFGFIPLSMFSNIL